MSFRTFGSFVINVLKPVPAYPALLTTMPISIRLLSSRSSCATLLISLRFDKSPSTASYLKAGKRFFIYVILLYNFSLFLATITTPNPRRANSMA